MSNYSSIKFYVHIRSIEGNIQDYLLLNCAFIVSDVIQSIVLQFAKSSIFKVKYLKNTFANYDDFGLILQDFEQPFRCNQLALALQFSFNNYLYNQ